MTKKTAHRKGWTIGRVMAGGYFARKGMHLFTAPTLKVLLTKLFILAVMFTATAGPNFNRAKCPLQCKGHVKKGDTVRQCLNAQFKSDTLCKFHIKKLSVK
jgi:hypothetical protein